MGRDDAVADSSAMHRFGPFLAGETPFTVGVADAGLAHAIAGAFRDMPRADAAVAHRAVRFDVVRSSTVDPERPWSIRRDGQVQETVVDWYVLPYLIWEVSRLAVVGVSDVRVPVHAGVVERDGLGVLFVGATHSGKSTTVAWFVRAGWRYVSDELGLVDPVSLDLAPFPRPIGLRRGGPFDDVIDRVAGPDVPEVLCSASDLGVVSRGAELALVVLLDRRTPGPTVPRRLSPAAGMFRLAQQVPSLDRHAARDFHRIGDIARRVPIFEFGIDDLDVAEGVVAGLLEGV